MINESYGIPNIIKSYVETIFNSIKNWDGQNDIILDFLDNKLKLKNLFIDVNIFNNNSIFDPSYVTYEDDGLLNVRLVIGIKNLNLYPIKIKELINHELNHVYEFYKIFQNKIKELPQHIINPSYTSISKSLKELGNDALNELKKIIYYSLDTEYNARISQLYQYIKQLRIDYPDYKYDKDFLFNKIKDSITYLFLNELESFNPITYTNELIDKLGVNAAIKSINDFNMMFVNNNVDDKGYSMFKKKINNNSDLYDYFILWKNRTKRKNEKHLSKIKSMIKGVLLSENRVCCIDNFDQFMNDTYKVDINKIRNKKIKRFL